MRPKAVVWDVGHVLYDWDPRFLYEKLIPDPSRLDWFLENVVTRTWHFQHDAGRPFAETSAELIAEFPEERALIEVYGPRWLETIPHPIPGSLALVEALDAADVPLFAITNFSAEFWEIFRPTAPIFDLFQYIVVSGVERLIKPDPAIFSLAQERFDLGPGEALFIDDNAANVAAARNAGWQAHHFTDAESGRAALIEAGFSMPPPEAKPSETFAATP
ncbi:MAG: HAD-IA family hydrolase [Sphingomonadaceae bacterium]